jgi:hypothetical protein
MAASVLFQADRRRHYFYIYINPSPSAPATGGSGVAKLTRQEREKIAETRILRVIGQSPEAATLLRAVLDAYQVYANVDFSSLPPGSRPLSPSFDRESWSVGRHSRSVTVDRYRREAETLGNQRRRHSARNDPRSAERRPTCELGKGRLAQ